ncbi:MAG: hypothetical protein ACR2P6_03510 [Gammaproteobacteria bacterium]
MSEEKKGFFARNKKYFIGSIVVYLVLTLLLILSSDGELLPFVYQVF